MTADELEKVEDLANDYVLQNSPVTARLMALDDARASGARALFGEKYGDEVRVVAMGQNPESRGNSLGWSVELCGGTHVRRTGDIGVISGVSDAGVAAGVRRIEAITGAAAVARAQQARAALADIVSALSTAPSHAVESVHKLQAEAKRLAREIEQLKMKVALGGSAANGGTADEPVVVDGVKLITKRVSGLEKGALRGISDSLRDRLGRGVVVLASENDGKVGLIVSVTKDLTGKLQAGRIVKELAPIVGGGGGGRPDFAEAGGKDPSKIDELLSRAPALIRTLLG
jgi:alanyl-tRNA synthetase